MWLVLIAIMSSILAGFLPVERLRMFAILGLWSVPLWFALWFTSAYSHDIGDEFGVWWAYLAFTPFILALWAAVTIFPFKLTVRLREISRSF